MGLIGPVSRCPSPNAASHYALMSFRAVGRHVRCSLKLLATPSKLRRRFEDLLAVFHLRSRVFTPVKALAALMHVRDAVGRGPSSSRETSAFEAALTRRRFFFVGVVVVVVVFVFLLLLPSDPLP